MDTPERDTPERSLDRELVTGAGSPDRRNAVRTRRPFRAANVILAVLLLGMLGAASWFGWVFGQIRYYSQHDQAQPADAIAVFGAAEYDGHPSPVLRARLDHALALYRQGLAPLIITLGGQGDENHSEGSVGRDYLMAQGVPESRIIAETQSDNTEASAEQLSIIAGSNNISSVIAVSDATHLFRIRAMCQRSGLRVFTSPRANGRPIGRSQRVERIAHELLSYTLWRVGL
jgi:uncharacterized SAM-binding protein YcdF (DUF218 family)